MNFAGAGIWVDDEITNLVCTFHVIFDIYIPDLFSKKASAIKFWSFWRGPAFPGLSSLFFFIFFRSKLSIFEPKKFDTNKWLDFFWLFADWNFVRYSWIHNKSFCKDLRLIYLRCTLTHFLWKNYDIESAPNWKNMSVHVLSHSNPHESDVSQNKIFFTSWH